MESGTGTKIVKLTLFAMFRVLLFYILFFIALMIMLSCQTLPLDTGVPSMTNPTLKAQLPFTANGQNFPTGVATVQRSSLVKISLKIPEKTYLVMIRTCARQEEFWNPNTKQDFKYDYMPAFDAENFGSCPMYITAVTTEGQWHRSILDFTNSTGRDATIDSMCNARWEKKTGSDICQVAAELPVKIESSKEAVIAKDPTSKCPDPIMTKTNKAWTINTKIPELKQSPMCVYVLLTKDKEEFRLTTTVYTSILNVFPQSK